MNLRTKRLAFLVVGLSVGIIAVACSDGSYPAASSGNGGVDASSGGPIERGDAARDAYAEAGDAGDAGADANSPFDGGGCLGDEPVQAGGLPPCPTSGDCAESCKAVAANLRLGLAQVALSCILKLPSCADDLRVKLCVDSVVTRACGDSTSATFCAPLVTPCDPNAGGQGALIDEASCQALGNALSAKGKGAYTGCVQSMIDAGTCVTDVPLCLDVIRK